MNVHLSKKAEKYYAGLNEPLRGRIRKALIELEKDPPQGDIKRLQGRDDYRVRVGDYRIVFIIENQEIYVGDIAPRGQVYKGGI
jgi:mRNA interferase RelE/StbE